jgi:hypothetical protein
MRGIVAFTAGVGKRDAGSFPSRLGSLTLPRQLSRVHGSGISRTFDVSAREIFR